MLREEDKMSGWRRRRKKKKCVLQVGKDAESKLKRQDERKYQNKSR